MSKKYIVSYIVFIVLLTITTIKTYVTWPNQFFHFITCDVGQGDALLLSYGFTQLLIDAGKDDSVLQCLDRNMPFFDRTIELFLITHPDFDHYGGAKRVLERFTVHTMAQLPLRKNDAEFEALQRLVQTKKDSGMQVIYPYAGNTLGLTEDIQLQFVWPSQENLEKLPVQAQLSETVLSDETDAKTQANIDGNPLSLTLIAKYKEISLLLTGDLEKEGELALLKSPLMMDIDILKVGHHGSKTSTTSEFILKTLPEIAVISVGENNQYNHPDQAVVRTLEKIVGKNIFRTDTQGEIHLVSDGNKVWKK